MPFVAKLSKRNNSLLTEISQTQKEKYVALIQKQEEVRLQSTGDQEEEKKEEQRLVQEYWKEDRSNGSQ